MKGIYLGACRAYHPNYDLDYNDIVSGYHINVICDMLNIDLSKYDYIIATPPCNYYSRANWRRDSSLYALSTKHLLPSILIKLAILDKPFIVENVRNSTLFETCGIYNICDKYGLFSYEYGRHIYFTNIMINLKGIDQVFDNIQNISNCNKHYRQGGINVHNVIDYWLRVIHD